MKCHVCREALDIDNYAQVAVNSPKGKQEVRDICPVCFQEIEEFTKDRKQFFRLRKTYGIGGSNARG